MLYTTQGKRVSEAFCNVEGMATSRFDSSFAAQNSQA